MISYLKGTPNLPLRLEAKIGMNLVLWWVDVSFKVYQYFNIQKLGVVSIGKGTVMDISTTTTKNLHRFRAVRGKWFHAKYNMS